VHLFQSFFASSKIWLASALSGSGESEEVEQVSVMGSRRAREDFHWQTERAGILRLHGNGHGTEPGQLQFPVPLCREQTAARIWWYNNERSVHQS
jgi:hypothetical protein